MMMGTWNLHVHVIMLHVNIIMLHVYLNKSYVIIINKSYVNTISLLILHDMPP